MDGDWEMVQEEEEKRKRSREEEGEDWETGGNIVHEEMNRLIEEIRKGEVMVESGLPSNKQPKVGTHLLEVPGIPYGDWEMVQGEERRGSKRSRREMWKGGETGFNIVDESEEGRRRGKE